MAARFPDGFIWGSSVSAHQVEGGNWANDWWEWEHTAGTPCAEPSGDACDFYHRYQDDLRLLASLGHRAFRFSLEWSRLEPEEGEFSRAQFIHYRDVLQACRDNGLTAFVTLHHFSSPRWFAGRGGWQLQENLPLFGRYAERVMRELGELIPYVCTVNEPNNLAMASYFDGKWPPGKTSLDLRLQVNRNLIQAHCLAVEAVKSSSSRALVGLSLSMNDYQAETGGEQQLESIRRDMQDVFLEAVRDDASDFIGVQTYACKRIGPQGVLGPEPGAELTDMGDEFWPAAVAIGATVRDAYQRAGKPVIVTENGVATSDDSRRIAFMDTALRQLHSAISDGVDVQGYLHWSGMDNFEWDLGFRPRFGLIAVDRASFERRPKPSANWYSRVIEGNSLDD